MPYFKLVGTSYCELTQIKGQGCSFRSQTVKVMRSQQSRNCKEADILCGPSGPNVFLLVVFCGFLHLWQVRHYVVHLSVCLPV